MNISEVLGSLIQTGLSGSSKDRLSNSMGGGGMLETLSGMLGGGQGKGGGLGDALSSILGGGGATGGGGLMDSLSGMLKGGGSGGGLGGLLGSVLGDASRAVGGNQNLALSGLGALAGALLGGGSKSAKGAIGGGLMAILGTMAYQALKGTANAEESVPLGVREAQTADEQAQLEQKAELILKAMINAAKSDGQVDAREMERIVGKLREVGADEEIQQFVSAELAKPMETEAIVAAAKDQPQLAAELYAASLLSIEVDTPAEKAYIDGLAAQMGIAPEATDRIQSFVGMK